MPQRRHPSTGQSTRAEFDFGDPELTLRFDAKAQQGDDDEIELPADGLIDRRYRVVDRIGDGGMGVVLRARDERLHRDVALKMIRPVLSRDRELVAQFLAEARAMAKLRHPNVVEVYDYGEHGSLPYFAMRFVDGPDLHTWIKQQELPLPFDVALGIFTQICEGVAAIHDAGVVHRDIKPENMLLDADFRVVVTDFGLVRPVMTEDMPKPSFQIEGGTAGYMAPELVDFSREPDPNLAVRTDVYALGILAYWLMVGNHPFPAKTRRQMLDHQRFARPEPPSEARPDLPRPLDRVILEALHKDPRRRTPDARQLAEQLRIARQLIAHPRPRIVVVDDDEPSRRWIARVLAEFVADADVEFLTSSERSLDHIEADPPALVITALENRGLSGLELAAAMRGNSVTEGVPLLVVSAVGGAAEWRALWQIGVQGFLLKPLLREGFVPLVRGLLPRSPLERTRSTRELGSVAADVGEPRQR